MLNWLLLLYGVSLGLPDLALPLGEIARLRLDDAVVALALYALMIDIRRTSWLVGCLHQSQKKVLAAWSSLAVYCVLSAVLSTAIGSGQDRHFWYMNLRMVGGMALMISTVMLASDREKLRWLCLGICIGGLLLAVQLVQRFQEVGAVSEPWSQMVENRPFHDFKRRMGFETWNPNTTGLTALTFAFAAMMGWALSEGRARRSWWIAAAVVFSMLPIVVFSRGSTIAMAVGWSVFFITSKRTRAKLILPLLLLAVVAWLWLTQYSGSMGRAAWDIDVTTGEGFSGRYRMWSTAWTLFLERPALGHGFGSEGGLFIKILGRGMSHSSYLSAMVELGLLGALLYFYALFVNFTLWYRRPPVDKEGTSIRAAALAMVAAHLVAMETYWSKPGMLAMAMAIAARSARSRTVRDAAEQRHAAAAGSAGGRAPGRCRP